MHSSITSSMAKQIVALGLSVRKYPLSVRFQKADHYRYAPVLSRKQGNAVARNRVKRVFRELMRLNESTFPRGSYLIYFSGKCSSFDRLAAEKELASIIGRLQIPPGEVSSVHS